MSSDDGTADKCLETPQISARDLSRIIRRMAHLFGSEAMGNWVTADALAHLADHLDYLGQTPIEKLRVGKGSPKKPRSRPSNEYLRGISLADVERMVDDEDLTKSDLTNLAKQRFGMPEAQLRRLPLAAVRDELRAALGHERSLEFIERNAELSGKSRRS